MALALAVAARSAFGANRVPRAAVRPGHWSRLRLARSPAMCCAFAGPGSSASTVASVAKQAAHEPPFERIGAKYFARAQPVEASSWLLPQSHVDPFLSARANVVEAIAAAKRVPCPSTKTAACACSEVCTPAKEARPTAVAMRTHGRSTGSIPSTKARSCSPSLSTLSRAGGDGGMVAEMSCHAVSPLLSRSFVLPLRGPAAPPCVLARRVAEVACIPNTRVSCYTLHTQTRGLRTHSAVGTRDCLHCLLSGESGRPQNYVAAGLSVRGRRRASYLRVPAAHPPPLRPRVATPLVCARPSPMPPLAHTHIGASPRPREDHKLQRPRPPK